MPFINPNRQAICEIMMQLYDSHPADSIEDTQILQAYAKMDEIQMAKNEAGGFLSNENLALAIHRIWGIDLPEEKYKVFWNLFYRLQKLGFEAFLTFVVPGLVCDPTRFCALYKNKSLQEMIAIIIDTQNT